MEAERFNRLECVRRSIEVMTYTLVAITLCVASYMVYNALDGVPQSLSATYYKMGGNGWLFQLLMAVCSFGLLPVWSELSNESWEFLAFLGCGGLLFVGASPLFRLPLERKVHHYSAYVCGASAVAWQLLEGVWVWLVLSFVICGLAYMKWRKFMWWLEMALIMSLLGNLWRIVI